MRQDNEASVEEILESIKKVIARDNRTGASIERQRRKNEGVREEAADEVDPVMDDEAEEILDLKTAHLIDEDETLDEIEADYDDDAPLIGDTVRDAMRENLAALAMISKPGVPPQIVRSGETSLEGLVRDLLRPMLSEWLDANLPGMVEKMVRDEIARIAGKRD